jgi:hypothetical protein
MDEFKIEGFSFKSKRLRDFAQVCLDNKKYLLFATCVDYPGLYKIPMYLYDGVRRELKELGFKFGHPKNYSDTRHRLRLFFLGPRRGRMSCTTRKEDATSFKVYFIFVTDWLKAQVAAEKGGR